MQKSSFSSILREELTRATVFGVGFFVVLSSGFVSIAYAADGGLFGTILNNILASGNWQTDTTGIVKNSEKLGGSLPSQFVKVGGIKTCSVAGQCVSGFDNTTGDVICITP